MLKLSILAVDDSPVITEMIKDAFEPKGYRILVASDGAEALNVALSESPDLIIADVNMPGMDGWELCSQIRSNPFTSFIPFIFLTSRNEAPDRIRGLQQGADDYLTKPFEMEELIARVELIFQRMRKTQEAMLLKEKKSLSGSTNEMALPDLLQMFGLNQKTGTIKISKVGYLTGKIAVDKGRVIRAELGGTRGQKALYRLLRWRDANFEVESNPGQGSDPDLGMSPDEVLMEGMRQMDEITVLEKDFPLSGKTLSIASPPAASELSPREEELLETIEKDGEFGHVIDSLPWTDLAIYKMLVYFIRKGVLAAS